MRIVFAIIGGNVLLAILSNLGLTAKLADSFGWLPSLTMLGVFLIGGIGTFFLAGNFSRDMKHPPREGDVPGTAQRSANKLPAWYRFFTSYGLACLVLIFMTIVTLIGTLEQGPLGLHAAKKKYFHSFYFTQEVGTSQFETWDTNWDGKLVADELPPKARGSFEQYDQNQDGIILPEEGESIAPWKQFTLILPGGLLLMSLLVINLILGAVLRVRKRWKGAGMLVAHFGMIFLLISGYVTWAFTNEGFLALYPGQTSNRIESYREWQFEILPLEAESEASEALVISSDDLKKLAGEGESRVFLSEKLPFEIELSNYAVNGAVVRTNVQAPPEQVEWEGKEINGFKLLGLRKRWKDEKRINIPAVYATFKPKGKSEGEPVETIISGESAAFRVGKKPMPFVFEQDGKKFAAQIVKKSWQVPYQVQLDEFIFTRHPGTSKPANYESRVTRIESDAEKEVAIRMNEPMRHEGLTFFQESFGSDQERPELGMYSQFAVNDNPADQWPLYALIVTGIGLLLHFLIKLSNFLERALRKNRELSPPLPES